MSEPTQPVEPARPRTVRRRVTMIVAAVLVAAVVAVLALGGLGQRTNVSIPMAPGQEVDTGMMDFMLSSATATYSSGSGEWSVVVAGKVRNPNSESLAPLDTMYGSVAGVDRATDQYVTDPAYSLGPSTDEDFRTSARSLVPPQSEWMDIRLQFTLEDPYEPSDTFPVALRPMVYAVSAILGYSDTKSWIGQNGARSFVVRVPLTVLPPE